MLVLKNYTELIIGLKLHPFRSKITTLPLNEIKCKCDNLEWYFIPISGCEVRNQTGYPLSL